MYKYRGWGWAWAWGWDNIYIYTLYVVFFEKRRWIYNIIDQLYGDLQCLDLYPFYYVDL